MIWKNWQNFPRKKLKNIQINIRRKKFPKIPQFFWVAKNKNHFFGEKKSTYGQKDFFFL
jgi:hypothetical protein